MTSAIFQSVTVRSLGQRYDIPPCLLDSSSPVTERGEDECPDARATDGDSGDDGPLLVEVLRDAVQPGQVDDAQPQADQAARAEVEEVDVGSHGAQHQTCSSQGFGLRILCMYNCISMSKFTNTIIYSPAAPMTEPMTVVILHPSLLVR